jgi:hypothetical protein
MLHQRYARPLSGTICPSAESAIQGEGENIMVKGFLTSLAARAFISSKKLNSGRLIYPPHGTMVIELIYKPSTAEQVSGMNTVVYPALSIRLRTDTRTSLPGPHACLTESSLAVANLRGRIRSFRWISGWN